MLRRRWRRRAVGPNVAAPGTCELRLGKASLLPAARSRQRRISSCRAESSGQHPSSSIPERFGPLAVGGVSANGVPHMGRAVGVEIGQAHHGHTRRFQPKDIGAGDGLRTAKNDRCPGRCGDTSESAVSDAARPQCHRSCEPASLMKRFRKSSRCRRMKMTKIAVMPVVVSGRSRGAISAVMLSSAVGGGWRTSTGIGLASWAVGGV
jgi:hypothetical protein